MRLLYLMINFIIIYLIVYSFYYVFMINKYDKDGNRKKKKEKKKKESKFLKALRSRFISEKDELLLRGRDTNKKKKKDKDEEEKIPTEVELLLYKYNLDMAKMNYKKLLKMIGSVCAFDIAFILTIIFAIPTNNIYIELIVGALLIIPVILISYSILGNYLKKKGMTKDEVRKRTKNRK